jgi:signal transduction histidine kinase
MSHELRTPLNAIIGFAEIIKSGVLGPDSVERNQEYAGDIYESGQHLLDLINDILDISKIELGSEQPKDVDIDVPVLIASILVLMKERGRKANVGIATDFQDQLPFLSADERKLKQILINLMSNSIKFTHPGGKVTLAVHCPSNEGFVFEVRDTGIGIAPEDLAKAMQPFGQIDSDLNRQYAGTGLGLPLAKELAEMHGGSLDVRSELGKGTTVTVRFPAARNVDSGGENEAVEIGAETALPAISQLP